MVVVESALVQQCVVCSVLSRPGSIYPSVQTQAGDADADSSLVGNGTAAGNGGGSAAAVVAGPDQEAEAGEPEGVLEELLLVPVSQLGLLTAGRKGSSMAVIARLSGATIVKEPKPKEEGEPPEEQQQQQEAEEEGKEEEELAGEKDEAEEGGQKGEERLVKVFVRSRVEAKMRAAVHALRAVLEGKVRWALILGE